VDMLTQGQMDDLSRFAWAWATARHGSLSDAKFGQAPVPEVLRERITAREPFRTQALDDTRLWLGMPVLTGIGLDVVAIEPLTLEAGEHWPATIADLTIDVSWSHDMTGRQREEFQFVLRRIGWEEGAWRLIELWDDPARAEHIRQMRLLEEFLRRKK
jgi:hypothetical protein